MSSLPPFILFDLDDTLFDHTRASRIALESVHAVHARDVDFDNFAREHARVLEVFHALFLRGEFSLDQARAARMIELFGAFEKSIDEATALDISMLYRREHQGNRALVAGARELLEALQHKTRMGIITNNSTAEQIEKLRALDIAHFFEVIVISEDVGVTKPDPRIFEIALERLGAKPHETVMIGDSFANDIEGAMGVGIAPLWLNRFENKSLISMGVLEHKDLERRPSAGVLNLDIATLTSFSPLASTLAAIEIAFNKHAATHDQHDRNLKGKNNAGMETLAT
jgi:HAD superfamily hydrolase (TIGR01549 family)